MTTAPLLLLAACLPASAQEAVPVRIGIEAPADIGYEIRAGEGRKLGRTGPYEGFSPEELVEVSGGRPSKVSISFYDEQGLLASCPAVEVRFQDSEALCQPRFVLARQGDRRASCDASCRPLPLQRKRRMERGWFSTEPGY